MTEHVSEDPESREATPARHVRVGICVFLALQIGLALGYYVSDDPYDERFAWRMFSTIRLTRCATDVRAIDDTGRIEEVKLQKHLAVAWISHIRRNRDRVVRKFLEDQCTPPTARLELTNGCLTPDGTRESHRWRIQCETLEIERTGP